MVPYIGMSVGTCMDLVSPSYLGNCASSKEACTVVKRIVWGIHKEVVSLIAWSHTQIYHEF